MDYTILHEAFSRKRAHESETDAEFAGVLIKHIASLGHTPSRIDSAGNIYYKVGESRSLFVAHIDTAHRRDSGPNSYRLYKSEKVRYKTQSMQAWEGAALVKADGDCLGADDGAGVMLLCWMLRHSVSGSYVFTRGEECGGIGAGYIAENHAKWLSNFDRAVCFDRRGYSDVITHQGGERCASDAFGEALSDALCETGMLYMPSDEGIYTDCKEFNAIIPECVNISTGYFHEHGPSEWLNLDHLRKLAQAVLQIKWEELPVARDPSQNEWEWTGGFGAARLDLYIAIGLALDDDFFDLDNILTDRLKLTHSQARNMWLENVSPATYAEALDMPEEEAMRHIYNAAKNIDAIH